MSSFRSCQKLISKFVTFHGTTNNCHCVYKIQPISATVYALFFNLISILIRPSCIAFPLPEAFRLKLFCLFSSIHFDVNK